MLEQIDSDVGTHFGFEALRRLREAERAKYDQTYYEHHYWREDNGVADPSLRVVYHDPGHQQRFAFLADLLVRQVAPQSVLDAGCGEGGLVVELRRAGVQSAGFEISVAGAERAACRCPGTVFRSSLDMIGIRTDAVDVVTCLDVLEHVPVLDIVESVRELVRVSRRYVVATINMDNIYEFHPTILSRESWNSVFAVAGVVEPDLKLQVTLQEECRTRYPEYEFFVFRKVRS